MPAINYSTTEQDTGVTWTDGKPIFQITVATPLTGLDPPPDADISPHLITTIETLIDIWASIQNTGGTEFLPVPRSGTAAPAPCAETAAQAVDLDVTADPEDVTISSTFDYTDFTTGHTTLRYTKAD